MFKPSKVVLISSMVLLWLLAAQCNGAQPTPPPVSPETVTTTQPEATVKELKAIPLAAGEKLKIVATSNIIGDMVRQVAGDNVELVILFPLGVDAHGYVPTPQDTVAVSQAHLILVNGLHYEEFLDKLLQNAGGQTQLVELSTGVEPRVLVESEHDEHAAEEESEHHHDGSDPHAWLTAVNALVYVQNIKLALTTLDPAQATVYETNAANYNKQLQELETWINTQIATIPPEKRRLVTDHDALGYYADHYKLTVIGAVIPGYSSMAEPSAQEMVALQEAIKSYNVKAIFVGTTVNPNLSKQVSQDMSVQLISLYTESLGAAGSGAETYLDYMRYNTTAIVQGLK